MAKTTSEILDVIIGLCEDLAWERPCSEQILYDLTQAGSGPPELVRLAEVFGLMLVKLGARDLERNNFLLTLRSQNEELKEIRRELTRRNDLLAATLAETFQQNPLIGESEVIGRVMDLAINTARHPINTLILGPTGSGKEVVAKLIHFSSPRKNNSFVAVNCSAIPESLFESEMFGIEKGVATGVERRRGLIESADGGTLFLDEVGDLSPAGQAGLLRVLEDRKVRRVGGREQISVDLHIISATNKNLREEVEQKTFREDLYYRLNVVEINMPPLCERGDDIILLARHFLRLHCTRLGRNQIDLSDEVIDLLQKYSWPGNVRELTNEMERAAALAEGPELKAWELSPRIKPTKVKEIDIFPESGRDLKSLTEKLVLDTLEKFGGNKSQAARHLGLSREGLRKRLKKTGVSS